MYDDYYRYNPPRKVAADADTLSRRLRAAAGPLSVSKARIDAVVARVAADPARALADARAAERDAKGREKAVEAERKKRETEAARGFAREQAEASRAQARVEKERSTRDPVAAEAIAPKALAGFLKDSMKKDGRYSVVAQRVGNEVWVGVVRGDSATAVRVPADAAPGVTTRVRGSVLKDEPALVLKSIADNGYAALETLLFADIPASNAERWDGLLTAWQDRASWSRANLTRSAHRVVDFAADTENRYALDCVLWDDVSSGIEATTLVRERLLSDAPLHGYDGAFVATDGSRLAVIGVEHAPEGGSVVFPRALLDYCDPREAWGKRYARGDGAAAIGPFVFYGRYTDFPDYRQVLPALRGLAFRFGIKEMDAVAPYYPAVMNTRSTSYSEFITRSDGTTGDMVVRYVPKDGDTCDYEAFPARVVASDAPVYDLGASDNSGKPRLFNALFLHDAFSAIRAGGEQSAVLVLPGDVLSPSAILTPAQMHIVMPVRNDKNDTSTRELFASALREAFQPYPSPDTVGEVSYYPEAVSFSTTGASYHALFRVLTYRVKPSNLRVYAIPVMGPSGYETWIIPRGVPGSVAMRLPGAKIDRAYDANDERKSDALLTQIFTAKRALPDRLSPGCPGGTLPELSLTDALHALKPLTDRTLVFGRVMVPPSVAASATRYLPEDTYSEMRAAYITSDGSVLATDGKRAYVAPGAVPDMEAVSVGSSGFVALLPSILHEIEQGAEELYIGATALAAGRVVVARPAQKPPDVLGFIEDIRKKAPKAIYAVESVEACIRLLTAASKKLKERNPTAVFAHGEPVSLGFAGSAGSVSTEILHAVYDTEGRKSVGVHMDYLADALASLRDSGHRKGKILLRGPLDGISVESDDATQPFSIVMPLRLD